VDAGEFEADFQACRSELIQRGQSFSDEQLDQIRRYGDLVVTRSAILNLISPGDRPRVFTRHISECLAPALVAAAQRSLSLVDIGSGAGLPGLPLAIAVPGLRVLLVEPRVRRSQFLEATTLALGLGDRVEVFQGSAERLLSASRGELGAGLATARAVDRLEQVWTWASGLLRAGGELAMYRALDEGDDALSRLVPAPAGARREPLPGQPRELLFLRRA
jgi:16S rRNA (guanine527-N7)-methyltransferase